MAYSLWDFGSDFFHFGQDTEDEYEDTASKASEKYKNEMDTIGKNYENEVNQINAARKSADQLYQEGKGTAAAMAGNKAGIAKQQAKAAAMQNSGSRLQAAIQGAQAATDASRQGFDESVESATGLAAANQNADIQNKLNAAKNKADLSANAAKNQYDTTIQSAENRRDSKHKNREKVYEGFGGLLKWAASK